MWVQDYQLQLVPRLLREQRPDLRIGWFNHIPFPAVELFAQIPWRRAILEGLLGADFLGFQRVADAQNFIRACRRLLQVTDQEDTVTMTSRDGSSHTTRASAIPISIDFKALEALASHTPGSDRAAELRHQLGDPRVLMLGVDRLDYTKGIRHRLKAYEELLQDKAISPPDVTFVQVATPSRERVEAYRELRQHVELTAGRINGEYAPIGSTALHYLHHAYPQAEMAALYLAADVMLVTPLRDGMNLVAKEYVTCRHDLGGALVLSEFTGAYHELHQAFVCNPHDIEGLKQTILKAINTPAHDKARIMRSLRRRVADHDVNRWASRFLDALAAAPAPPAERPPARTVRRGPPRRHRREHVRTLQSHPARARTTSPRRRVDGRDEVEVAGPARHELQSRARGGRQGPVPARCHGLRRRPRRVHRRPGGLRARAGGDGRAPRAGRAPRHPCGRGLRA